MPYCSQANLVTRFGDEMMIALTDRKNETGVIDAAIVAQALTDTDAMIDGYLAGRYQLPLAATPQLLTDVAERIAIYKLHTRITDDKIRIDYEDAVKSLVQISNGTIRLNVAGAEPAAASAGQVLTNDVSKPLSGGSMAGFI